MRRKDDSVRTNFVPELAYALQLADEEYGKRSAELVITSGTEHTAHHSYTSLHYNKSAADTRTWKMGTFTTREQHEDALRRACDKAADDLGFPRDWFDVVLEATHLHTEYQPKRLS